MRKSLIAAAAIFAASPVAAFAQSAEGTPCVKVTMGEVSLQRTVDAIPANDFCMVLPNGAKIDSAIVQGEEFNSVTYPDGRRIVTAGDTRIDYDAEGSAVNISKRQADGNFLSITTPEATGEVLVQRYAGLAVSKR